MGRPPETRGTQGGVPDGLLVGLLALLFASTLMVWTATGVAGLFAHGSWPAGVTFGRSPLALRSLVTDPRGMAAAWPATPADQLPGHGVFWGLLIGELMVLAVLAVFAVGTVSRWRAVRAAARTDRGLGPRATTPAPAPLQEQAPLQAPAPAEAPAAPPAPVTTTTPLPATAPAPAPAPAPAVTTPPTAAPPATATAFPAPRTPAPRVLYGDRATRRPSTLQAVQDAVGPVLVVTSDPTVWAETKDARAKLGPVLLYDPGHLCDTPARLHWSPTDGCEDTGTAAARATALLAPVRPRARLDAAVADTAETLLRCWLHAAAVDGRPFRQVHRWAQNNGSAHEPVRILRIHPRATNSHAGLLESALTAHPERREAARALTLRALSALTTVHVRESCTPNRTDSLTLESFIAEGGSLYVVGEPVEDPRTAPGAMPLLTALTAHVVEHGRRMAARSSDGRLDPPMSLVLDDVAAVAPLPQLPALLANGHDQGLPTLVLLRSREQARARWTDPLPTPIP
ncbi:P-loop NTPase family protein [Streptomyces kanasensis]|uniref:type VI secretion protein n=1 Tax=Streptomyces kanasensis TaxID=936756 RepID=UPI00382B37C9